jgi:uncharacterized protein DUF4129
VRPARGGRERRISPAGLFADVASPRRRTRPVVSPILAAVLVGSLIVGIAATYLAAPASQNVAPGRGAVSESPTIVIEFSEALLIVLVVGVVLYAIFAPRAIRIPGAQATILSVFLVSLVFLVIVRFLVPSNPIGVPVNQTVGPPPPMANTTLSNGTISPLPVAGVPGWELYVGLGIAVVVTLVLLAPALSARRAPPEDEAVAKTAVRRSLESALAALADQNPTDARQIIIGLYARLLETVGPYVDSLDAATPREIELEAVRRFGIGPSPAAELTRLFEEARYSTHPFTDDQVARARRALESALLQVKVRSYSGGA